MLTQWVASAEWTPGESVQLRARRRVRKVILRVADPVVRYPASGGELRMPLSHEMPTYRRLHPTYDRPLEEAAAAIRVDAGSPSYAIDVGGNVGDSALALLASGVDAVLCVEGVPRYVRLLHDNVDRLGERVVVAPYFITETAQQVSAHVARGTAIASRGNSSDPTSITFTDLLARYPSFAHAQLVKIDTDGLDQAVMRSAADWLRERRPAIFFEHDPALQQNQGYHAAEVWPFLEDLGYRSARLWSNTGIPLWQGNLDGAPEAVTTCLMRFPYVDVLVTAATAIGYT
jgi:FkbM family methyltransferase